jgi:hypothetical protein
VLEVAYTATLLHHTATPYCYTILTTPYSLHSLLLPYSLHSLFSHTHCTLYFSHTHCTLSFSHTHCTLYFSLQVFLLCEEMGSRHTSPAYKAFCEDKKGRGSSCYNFTPGMSYAAKVQ